MKRAPAQPGNTRFASPLFGLILLGCPILLGCASRAPEQVSPVVRWVDIAKVVFHGWPALVMRNKATEVVVVPSIGRVMQMRLVGEASGPIWNHPRIGAGLAADENGWINFGGDKAWPSPQGRWAEIAGKGWPPPRTFDQTPYASSVIGDIVELLSPVDPAYGVRVRRRIALAPDQPKMTIETSYEKVQGPPIEMGVWTITQLGPPERLFALLPASSTFAGGYVRRLEAPPNDLSIDGQLLSLARDPAAKTMIGTDADALLWLGDGPSLLIEHVSDGWSGQTPGGAPVRDPGPWPDGAHAQIYTSPDDAERYVELELFGRLRTLRPGDTMTLTARYTLVPRATNDLVAEAKRVFATSPTR